MKYLSPEDIKYLQIDHNSTCNLLCPQCARIHNNKTNPSLPLLELTVESYITFFSEVNNVKEIMFCGNYGEVTVSNTFIECLKYVIDNTSARIIITTNGSTRNEQWWKELANLLKGRGKVIFSVDGLEDTNHLYRVNSNWNKIIKNMKAFIDSGGEARWDYLVFSHNEHQVDEAHDLAKEMGFKQFQIKLTNRFVNDKQYKTKNGMVQTEMKSTLNIPINTKYQGSGKTQNEQILEKFGTWTNYVNATPIECKWKPNGKIFLDFEGRIWPCTWTASGYHHYGENTQKTQTQQLFNKYGVNFNSLHYYTLSEILDNDYFANDLCQSWKNTMDSEVPKLLACGRTCGSDYEFSSAYGKNRRMFDL